MVLLQTLANCLRASRFAATLLVFLIVNACLMAANPVGKIDPESLPLARSWIWWAVHDFLKESKPPEVVLLGSSLLMNPLWQEEADFLNAPFDIVANRRTRYLESELGKQLGVPNPACFNFALPGAFASDDYMIIRTMLAGEHAPKILVLALSPRDFIDNGFNCPAFSPAFRYLKRYTRLDDLVGLAMPHFWQRAGYLADSSFYLFGRRLELVTVTHQALVALVDHCLGPEKPAGATPQAAPGDVLNAIYKDELIEGVFIAKPHMTPPYNPGGVEIYRQKYRTAKKLDNQLRWLDMALSMCAKQGIKVVVLNMPVTQVNLSIYPSGVYQACVGSIANAAKKYGCPFLDLQNSHQFNQKDFTDMWHMNAGGGRKVLDAVAELIKDDEAIASSLAVPGQGHVQLAASGKAAVR